MTGAKTNERPGTRASVRGFPMSASKARVVLNIVRGEDVNTAREILAGTTREAADVIAKVLASAVANAVTNDGQNVDELYISAAYADEGITMKRFSPRARGRAGKIFKRSTHITVIVSRMDEERLERLRGARSAQATASRSRRVASSRRRADQQASFNKREAAHEAQAELDASAELEANAELETTESDVVTTDVATDVTADVATEVSTEVEPEVVELSDVATEDDAAPADENDDTVSDDTTEETN
jgi:large subunit ribosomal protein L22